MFKKIIIGLLVILTFLNYRSTAFADWQKNSTPILTPSSTGWDKAYVRLCQVLYENGLYKMFYHGSDQTKISIGLAQSTDGLNWTKFEQNPIITPADSPGISETDTEEATVVHNDIYRLWYNSSTTKNCQINDCRYKIRYAASTDGINWSKYPTIVLQGEADWEKKGVGHPYVLFENGIYHMWYAGWGYGFGQSWKAGYATSIDGINWTKSLQNPLNLPTLGHIGSPSVIKINDKYHMYYHTGGSIPTAIYHVVSTDKITWQCEGSCLVLQAEGIGFDSYMANDTNIMQINNQLHLYYSGHNGNFWQIGLAKDIEENKTPLVLIPGLMASWNKEAIIYNQNVTYDKWKLLPFVKEYQGIEQALLNLGYVQNTDFYIFPYDWRKSIDNSANDLKNFINTKLGNQPQINLIGHSLGGLVGRIYLQKYGAEKINKLITVGSPHQGAALVYKVVEAGETEKDNTLKWLAEKIILVLNKDKFETDKETINQILPVARDLLPTYNFLKNENNQEINVFSMTIKNDALLFYNPNLPNLPNFPNILQTVAGEKGDTIAGYKVGPRTVMNQLLNLYPDGRPVENFYQIGDYTVIANSAKAGNNPLTLNFDHGEIIYKKEAIKKILESFSIPYQDNQIIEGTSTKISPSLIFLILSPAEMEVFFDSQTYLEQDGLIFIENAELGEYFLKVKGKDLGRYTVIIGQIGDQKDNWTKIEGEITQMPPNSPNPQTDTYIINFNPQSPQFPLNFPITLFDELILYLTDLNKTLKKTDITKAVTNLTKGKQYFQENNKGKLKSALLLVHQQLFLGRGKLTNENDKKKILYAVEKLEILYEKALGNYKFGLFPSRLKNDLTNFKSIITSTQNYLLSKKQSGKNVLKNTKILIEIQNRLNSAEESINKNNLNLAEILLKSVSELIKEVRKV